MRAASWSGSVLVAALASPVMADGLPDLADLLGGGVEVTRVDYDCGDGGAVTVRYINGAATSLAILPVDGTDRLFVDTLSASGARYVSGVYEWWSKSRSATLADRTEAGAVTTCVTDEATR